MRFEGAAKILGIGTDRDDDGTEKMIRVFNYCPDEGGAKAKVGARARIISKLNIRMSPLKVTLNIINVI